MCDAEIQLFAYVTNLIGHNLLIGVKILFCWLGATDLRPVIEGADVGLSPVAQALTARPYRDRVLLNNWDPYQKSIQSMGVKMPIEIMPETISANVEKPTERLSGEEQADMNFFVQVKNTEAKTIELKNEDVTIAVKNSSGKILVAKQPQSINGNWDSITMQGNSSKILNLEFLISRKIAEKISSDVGSIILEIKSHSVEISVDETFFD